METEFKPNVPENPYSPPEAGLPAAPAHPTARQELASRLSRLGAVMLDGAVFGLCSVPAVLSALPLIIDPASPDNNVMIFGMATSGLAFLALIGVNLYLMSKGAQTIGKRALGIKVVDLDGVNASLSRMALLRVVPISLLSAIPIVGPLVQLLDAAMIFGDDRRCLHDLIAKTRVVVADKTQ